MSRIWKIFVTGFGLLMFAFTLGYGPALFPGYKAGPDYNFSAAGKSLSETNARIVAAPILAAEQPEMTWRNRVSKFFMLEPVNMTSVPAPDRSELQKLRARGEGRSNNGRMAVSISDY